MKNLCSGTHRGGFQFLLILDLWGVSFHAVVVFGLGKDLLFKSALGHCDIPFQAGQILKMVDRAYPLISSHYLMDPILKD